MAKVYIYGLGERLWHWGQALSIAVLIFTGFAIHLLVPGGISFLELYNWHTVFGFVLIVNTFIGNIYFLSNHRVSQFIPYMNSEFADGFMNQFKYYILGRFQGQAAPFEKTMKDKLNPLQKISYYGMLFIAIPVQIVTGLLMYYYKGFAHEIVQSIGGIEFISVLHVIMSFIFMMFLIIHVYMTFLAKPFYNYYRGMITGYEMQADKEEQS